MKKNIEQRKSPMVTVVIPVKDRPDELMRSIKSVLVQTLDNIEVIIVENNSRSPDIIKQKVDSLNDARIRFYSLARCQNANVARNFGSQLSNGKYISFLDSDDEYEPGHLARCVCLLEREQACFVYGSAKINNGKAIRQVDARALGEDETAFSYLFGGDINWAPTPTYMISRSVLQNVQWDESLYRHQDFDFFIQVVTLYKSIVNSHADVIINWPEGVRRSYHSMSMRIFYRKWSSYMSRKQRRHYCYGKIRVSIKMLDMRNFFIFLAIYAANCF